MLPGWEGLRRTPEGRPRSLAVSTLHRSPEVIPQAWVLEDRSGDGVQTLELSHVCPAPGDTLRITSVVVNHGRARSIEARICGLDLATDLELRDPFGRCHGHSMKGTLTAGDTLHSSEMGVAESGPGVYRVRIRHLLDPERWIRANIEVVQASTAR